MSWSATQYSKFEDERSRPARDLIARIPAHTVANAVDIGCGPGNSTELLRDRFPEAVITAIDNSADMIEAARKRLPGITFRMDDIATWRDPGPFDIILANAALQWVPDHEFLLPKLIERLASGGCLAVQMPDNLDEPSHRIMREIAADGPWADKLTRASAARAIRREADWYYRTLQACNTTTVDIWRTTYYHPLAGGAEAVTEWFKATGLRPFLDPLDETERSAFLARYQASVALAYPAMSDGTVLLPFPRLFFVATRNATPDTTHPGR
jgi:trans-aconitate 2-methyltransferase